MAQPPTLAKLTSISTQTLSLLLERQRMQMLPSFSPSSDSSAPVSMATPQVIRNLSQLKDGILALEANEGPSEAVGLLRNQYQRMRGMLGPDVCSLAVSPRDQSEAASPAASTSSLKPIPPSPDSDDLYTPYTDDPDYDQDPGILLQTQRTMMDEQDVHLDRLSKSINRQRDLSMEINDELDVHTGLLQELDTDIERASTRLTDARRRLDYFARGAKENGSAIAIAVLIFILLILIIVLKT
ncbi:hypothetical protein FISHEDRAFT_35906 [Fistulina hepatica ATCC 64428]|uniref:t-SNARE coiled-coil homology domain-containing protein n=1 Tax=Fistulina hepatica ATCC 64428 TaxID=1128425 RepID=A0A0D7AKC4_9AGAR|nr:hypothetical protein FISHEDRAFT_35906 [Fistulina hepatica ATCC 64428]